ncbi:uncharacterized protein OCT59_016035 [Rhizophagus irregularis]|uniref:RNA-dependent RNA polymerase n=3 Tax=Rhizophagus irregularis TaxID=588596 RepID=A0A015JML7_RHIIW|nr:hypothetical protein RirG_105120 [Rhizophagus irregularis DAOM 197198w]UZO23704.1 hypothetical protein OCT59_016035 [Rhizophagus irregularis]GBC30926.1 RNA-dependent RNA polymerase 1 [Rhizophagus irregularis DAOM 181602=DAOM 197198]
MPPNEEFAPWGDICYDRNNYGSRRHYNSERYFFRAESLEFGVYLKSDTFVSEMKFTEKVNFVIDYSTRKIKVEFSMPIYDKDNNKIDLSFSLNTEFKDMDGEIYIEQQGPYRSITIANKFPAKYSMFNKTNHTMKRMTRIQTPKCEGPLQPHMPNDSEQLGKWVVYKITFDFAKNEKIYRFKEMFKKAKDYNLTSGKLNPPLKLVDGKTLNKYVDRSMLNFDVLYLVECNISFNHLHDYNLSKEFFYLLHKLPSESAIHILEKIYENKKRIYDPISYLRSEFKRIRNIDFRPKHVPDHCSMMRKVIVTPTTMYMLPPNMETSNRVIRYFKCVKDNFLRVHFVDESSNKVGASSGDENENHSLALYNRIYYTLREGIKIGDIHYEFLAFSSSQLRDHSCWFFASTNSLTANDIRKWMGDFSDKTVAKYAARMGQCFSSTRAIQRLLVNDIEEIPDIERNGYVFSDGIGKISPLLAKKIVSKLELKNNIPSAFQFRMAGYKGMLCQDNTLQGNQVKVRKSQRKFESTHNELEIIRCSAYIPSFLNRQAITLLSVLGIPDEVFIRLKDQQVDDLNKIYENENKAINTLQQNSDEYGVSHSLADYIKAGFLQENDPYLVNLISLFRITMLRDIKKKAKIRVNKGAFLLGVLDETNTLKEDEVYCCVRNDPNNPSRKKLITGTCIVYRNPCFHPGDVRIVKAVECDALKDLVDVLVFPQVGERDIPNQCSGGDLDGDDFTIIYDEDLIPKKIEEPMNYKGQKPEVVEKVTMDDIKKFFVNYVFSDQLGRIANAHLARADFYPEGAKHESCIKLAHLHSDAVDFPKTGIPAVFPTKLRVSKFPDFMEKPDKPVYQSKKVLGTLYRSIKEEDYKPYVESTFDTRLCVKGYEKYLEEARIHKSSYDRSIKALMNQFGIMTEFEVVSGYIINTHPIDKKKTRDVVKCVMDAITPIKKYYRKLFDKEFYCYDDENFTFEASIQMQSKAYAWYYVTYHPSEQSEENMISFPWIVGDILCKIALKNHPIIRRNEPVRNLQQSRQLPEQSRQPPQQSTVNHNNFTTNRSDINVNNCSKDLFNSINIEDDILNLRKSILTR